MYVSILHGYVDVKMYTLYVIYVVWIIMKYFIIHRDQKFNGKGICRGEDEKEWLEELERLKV